MTNRMRFWWHASAVVVAGSLLCLLVLTLLHTMLDTAAVRGFDFDVQRWIHGWPQGWLRAIMFGLTDLGAIRTFAVSLALVLGWLRWRGHRHEAALLSFAITGALVLNEILKLHFHRPRPTVPWSIGDEHTYSFPSGHSLFSVVLYGTLCWLGMRPGRRAWEVLPVALGLPLAIGTSRVYLGEHWPSDIVAGWLCGGIWLGTVLVVDELWRRTRYASPTQPPEPFV